MVDHAVEQPACFHENRIKKKENHDHREIQYIPGQCGLISAMVIR